MKVAEGKISGRGKKLNYVMLIRCSIDSELRRNVIFFSIKRLHVVVL